MSIELRGKSPLRSLVRSPLGALTLIPDTPCYKNAVTVDSISLIDTDAIRVHPSETINTDVSGYTLIIFKSTFDEGIGTPENWYNLTTTDVPISGKSSFSASTFERTNDQTAYFAEKGFLRYEAQPIYPGFYARYFDATENKYIWHVYIPLKGQISGANNPIHVDGDFPFQVGEICDACPTLHHYGRVFSNEERFGVSVVATRPGGTRSIGSGVEYPAPPETTLNSWVLRTLSHFNEMPVADYRNSIPEWTMYGKLSGTQLGVTAGAPTYSHGFYGGGGAVYVGSSIAEVSPGSIYYDVIIQVASSIGRITTGKDNFFFVNEPIRISRA